MCLPGFPPVGTAALVHAGVEAPLQLREHVGVMQRLQPRQLLLWLALRGGPAAPPPRLRHLVEDPGVVGEAGLPGRHRLEDLRVATLPLKVDQRRVPGLEIERRERLPLQHQAERDVLAGILAAPDAAPKAEVVHELEQLEVLRVAGDGPQHLLHEGLLDALPPPVFAFALLRAAVFRRGLPAPPALLRPRPADLLGWVSRAAAPLPPDIAGAN